MIVFGTNHESSSLKRATGSRSPRASVLVRLSVDRWPVVLHEVFQAGEHHAPFPFRTLARLVGEIVVLTHRSACLRSVAGQLHGHDVVVLRQVGRSSKRTEVAELEHTLSDDLKNDAPVLVRPALPLADPH